MMRIQTSILILTVQKIICQQITEIPTPNIGLAKSPNWDDDTQSLYFINLMPNGDESLLYRYSLVDDRLYSANVSGVESTDYIIPVSENGMRCKNFYAIGNNHDAMLIEWDGISPTTRIIRKLFSIAPNDDSSVVDYARTDQAGRYYGGIFSMTEFCSSPANKSFYRHNIETGVVRIFGDVLGTTGIAFNENARKLYFVGLCSLIINEFDWNPLTGDIGRGNVAFDFSTLNKSSDSFVPLSLELDSNGMVYTSDYRNSIFVVNPRTKTVVREIDVGVTGVSGAIFGGPNRDILFVTAAAIILDLYAGKPMEVITNGSSLYKVTGLGQGNTKSTSLNVIGLDCVKIPQV